MTGDAVTIVDQEEMIQNPLGHHGEEWEDLVVLVVRRAVHQWQAGDEVNFLPSQQVAAAFYQ